MRSQGTTDDRPVCFPFWMAREIALDLSELDKLRLKNNLNLLRISNLKLQKEILQEQSLDKTKQYSLLWDSYGILQSQYEAEKAKKPESGFWKWVWRIGGALGIGYLLGSIAP